jgi:hypothetical protein
LIEIRVKILQKYVNAGPPKNKMIRSFEKPEKLMTKRPILQWILIQSRKRYDKVSFNQASFPPASIF